MSRHCSFCRPFRLVVFRPVAPCPICKRPMVQLQGEDLGGVVLHCPSHCSTVMPKPSNLPSD